MKKKSLIERMKEAERREEHAKRRVKGLYDRIKQAELVSKGAEVVVVAIAEKIGPVVHISAEELEQAKEITYSVKVNEDKSVDMIRSDMIEKEPEK